MTRCQKFLRHIHQTRHRKLCSHLCDDQMSELVAVYIHQVRSLELCSHQCDDQMSELVTAYTPDTSSELLRWPVWWILQRPPALPCLILLRCDLASLTWMTWIHHALNGDVVVCSAARVGETDFHTIFWWCFRWEILRESVNTTSSAVIWRQHFQNYQHHQNHHCCHYHHR